MVIFTAVHTQTLNLVCLRANLVTIQFRNSFSTVQKFSSDPIIVIPDIAQHELGPDDELLVVATDGLWDVLPPLDALRIAKFKFKDGMTAAEVSHIA